jgi:hypothetical protein
MMDILENKYKFGEQIFIREEPSITLVRAISIKDNQSYLLKIWRINN